MAALYGCAEIATPIFEFTEVFARPIGEHTREARTRSPPASCWCRYSGPGMVWLSSSYRRVALLAWPAERQRRFPESR